MGWYKRLEDSNADMFYTEYDCSSTEGLGVILDCLKNRIRCFIEYQTDHNRTIFYDERCLVIKGSYRGDTIDIECDGCQKTLSASRILRSAYTIADLI